MFTKNINAVPCKLLKFTYSDHEQKTWKEIPEEKIVSHPDQVETEVKNSFLLEGNLVLIVTDEMIIFLNEKLQELNFIKPEEIDECISYVTCFTQDIASGFLFACQATPETSKYAYYYEGSNRENRSAWMLRCNINIHQRTITYPDLQSNSIYLINENIHSVLEYAINKMIVHVAPTDILTVHNWQVVHILQDSAPGNNQKYWLCPLPGFNVNSFPFIVSSGS